MRVAVATKAHPVFYTWHNRNVEHSALEIAISAGFATEAELLAAKSMVKALQAGQIDVLLKLLREGEQPKKPLRVEIVNAGELKSDKVISIKRDENSGKMTGAIVAYVT